MLIASVIALLVLVFLGIIVANIRVVSQTEAFVIERLGSYLTTWESGLNLKIPFIDTVSKKVSLKEQVVDFQPQPVITKDNVTMQIDSVVYFSISDPKLFAYGVNNPLMAIENLTATTLRNIIGELELDQTLTSRDVINTKMRAILDEATDPWGIKINRVELKNILPPKDIQEAMEKQMRAEREKRESILRAEGQKDSAVLIAQGNKEARILNAEGEKQESILRAEANKETQIREAEGQAEAILKINVATAEAFDVLNKSVPNDKVLQLKALEAFIEASKGSANKIIIPTDIASVVSGLTVIKETMLGENKSL